MAEPTERTERVESVVDPRPLLETLLRAPLAEHVEVVSDDREGSHDRLAKCAAPSQRVGSRAASRREHQRFCEIEGWTTVLDARGKPIEHHITHVLAIGDGRILRTRISRLANAVAYGKGMWAQVLRDELHASEAEFWECVDNKDPPQRSVAPSAPQAAVLPAGLAYQLVNTLGLSREQVAALTLEAAVAKMNEHWTNPAQ